MMEASFVLLGGTLGDIILYVVFINLPLFVRWSLIRRVRSLFTLLRPSREIGMIQIGGKWGIEWWLVALQKIQRQIKLTIVPWGLLAHVWGIFTEEPTIPYQLVSLWLSLEGFWLFMDRPQFWIIHPQRSYFLFTSIFLNSVKLELQPLWVMLHEHILSIKIDFLSPYRFWVLDEMLNRTVLNGQSESCESVTKGKYQSIQGNDDFFTSGHWCDSWLLL